MAEKINVHIYPSPFENDSRILKITGTLAANGCFGKIYIMATAKAGLPETEDLDAVRTVIRINRDEKIPGLAGKIFRTIQWSWRLAARLKAEKISCVNCHSLPVLPLCVLIKLIHGAVLIYDTHELETETAEARGVRKPALKILERLLMPFVDKVVAVSDGIAAYYQQKYGLPAVTVVKNVPSVLPAAPEKTDVLREKFAIPEDSLVFLYQGKIAEGRNIELLLEVFSRQGPAKHIVFMGFGSFTEDVKAYACIYPNIHYQDAAPPDRILDFTVGADAGFSILGDTCLNHRLALPNKLFEYINCGVPVIVSDFPEMGAVVDDWGCGWKVKPVPAAIEELITRLDRPAVETARQKAVAACGQFTWQQQEPRLLALYARLGFCASHIQNS